MTKNDPCTATNPDCFTPTERRAIVAAFLFPGEDAAGPCRNLLQQAKILTDHHGDYLTAEGILIAERILMDRLPLAFRTKAP